MSSENQGDELQHDSQAVSFRAFRDQHFTEKCREIAEETPVAISFNGTTHAVMMASPSELEHFGIGFSFTEEIIESISDIQSLDIITHDNGIEIQIWLDEQRNDVLVERRRFMAGPVGCGLCGIDSLDQATRSLPVISGDRLVVDAACVINAMNSLAARQKLNALTRAVHGAGFYLPGQGMVDVKEDVGRHNALDKLIGGILSAPVSVNKGLVVITSRISVELVQKAALLGVPVLAAISAPTALAIRTAEQANLTLVALVRGDEFDIYTHPQRIRF